MPSWGEFTVRRS